MPALDSSKTSSLSRRGEDHAPRSLTRKGVTLEIAATPQCGSSEDKLATPKESNVEAKQLVSAGFKPGGVRESKKILQHSRSAGHDTVAACVNPTSAPLSKPEMRNESMNSTRIKRQRQGHLHRAAQVNPDVVPLEPLKRPARREGHLIDIARIDPEKVPGTPLKQFMKQAEDHLIGIAHINPEKVPGTPVKQFIHQVEDHLANIACVKYDRQNHQNELQYAGLRQLARDAGQAKAGFVAGFRKESPLVHTERSSTSLQHHVEPKSAVNVRLANYDQRRQKVMKKLAASGSATPSIISGAYTNSSLHSSDIANSIQKVLKEERRWAAAGAAKSKKVQ